MDEYYNAIQRFPNAVRSALSQLSPVMAQQVQEIRVRSGRPIVFSTANGQILAQNIITKAPADSLFTNHVQLQECFYSLCEQSVHSYEKQLAQGFFTLPGGHRVGVAGAFHKSQDTLMGIQTVTSLNIRVARAIFAPLPELLKSHLSNGFRGMVVAGPPGSGKTTLLRSIIRELSNQGMKTAVVDERCELWPCGPWGITKDIPLHCDVLTGCTKAFGIQSAVRSLGPQVVACDEIGSSDEMTALTQGRCSGVEFLCSVHAYDFQDVQMRLGQNNISLAQLFSCCVMLHSAKEVGSIREILWL